jgi:hypothetical protein
MLVSEYLALAKIIKNATVKAILHKSKVGEDNRYTRGRVNS